MDRAWRIEEFNQLHPMVRLRDKRVVTIGGGTGPFALLSALKRYPCLVTAIVTMSASVSSTSTVQPSTAAAMIAGWLSGPH